MKHILVTGASGYIGRSFLQYIKQFPAQYEAGGLGLRDDVWKKTDFSKYDAVLHAAGLAHVRETTANQPRFFAINRDLTSDVAGKARDEGVPQFIFLSSMSVYGKYEGIITPGTSPQPNSSYGASKLEAERLLQAMETATFRPVILRLPMVYGPDCKGNYQALVKLARFLPVCPDYQNRRSAISIENLCAYIRKVIDGGKQGLFFPQDSEYFCTCRMIQRIARENGKQLQLIPALNFGPEILRRFTVKGKKAFGNLVYCDESQRGHARL